MAQRLDSLEEKFLNTIKKCNLIEKGDKIVVGVSGGPDSITLLTCLNKYKEKLGCEIICAHVNHLIREDSTEDEQYVENYCSEKKIPFYAKRFEVLKIAKENKKGTEEMAREIRYEFFKEVLKKENANKIAIAHNKNDNAETMLLSLIRGSGMAGLEGLQPLEYDIYIRPLIDISRCEIEEYCRKNNLKPRIDSTNKENIYTRNVIRNEVLPIIKDINPNIIETLSRTSKIIKLENEFIKEYTKERFENISKFSENIKDSNEKSIDKNAKRMQKDCKDAISLRQISFDLKEFNNEPEGIRKRLIIMTIEKLLGSTKSIEKTNVDDIVKLAERNIGNKYLQINKKIKIFIKNKKIFFQVLT